jgi:hypothetical protein
VILQDIVTRGGLDILRNRGGGEKEKTWSFEDEKMWTLIQSMGWNVTAYTRIGLLEWIRVYFEWAGLD